MKELEANESALESKIAALEAAASEPSEEEAPLMETETPPAPSEPAAPTSEPEPVAAPTAAAPEGEMIAGILIKT